MPYGPLEGLLREKKGSIYKLVILASKRALEIEGGAPKLTANPSKKSTTIALQEIIQGKVDYKKAK
jgi:DNA-directed RNA polymerase omega subunit